MFGANQRAGIILWDQKYAVCINLAQDKNRRYYYWYVGGLEGCIVLRGDNTMIPFIVRTLFPAADAYITTSLLLLYASDYYHITLPGLP